jgi:hypothetical protein
MADKKISALTGAATPLVGTEVLPIVQSGSTVKVSVANLTAGRAVNASSLTASGNIQGDTVNFGTSFGQLTWDTGVAIIQGSAGKDVVIRTQGSSTNRLSVGASDVTVGTGNVVIGTAAKGIDFSANSHGAGMTSELLNDYEEGDWTPTQGAGLTVIGTYSATGKYTKIGRQVTIIGEIVGSTSVAVSSGGVLCAGLPYTTIPGSPSVFAGGLTNTSVDATSLVVGSGTTLYASTAVAATTRLYFSATYLTS